MMEVQAFLFLPDHETALPSFSLISLERNIAPRR
jgi:hypothetical protein